MSLHDSTKLCEPCTGLLSEQDASADTTLSHGFGHKTLQDLRGCVESCTICSILLRRLESHKDFSSTEPDDRYVNLELQVRETRSQVVNNQNLQRYGIIAKEIYRAPENVLLGFAYRLGSLALSSDDNTSAEAMVHSGDVQDQADPTERAMWTEQFSIDFASRLPLLKYWMRECTFNHENCHFRDQPNLEERVFDLASAMSLSDTEPGKVAQNATADNERRNTDDSRRPFLPTRLLDVSPDVKSNDADVKLITTADLGADGLGNKAYMTLSHCWGPEPTGIIKTTLQNQAKHRSGLMLSELPRNFQDAVRVTRMLDVRYLWIDSLCIIQDSDEDWQFEAARMGMIYHHSLLTLAASGSNDAHTGFFLDDAKPSTIIPDGAGNPHASLRCPAAREEDLHSSPLQQRGWTLQELVLSRRTVHFQPGQMYWQCHELLESEDGTVNDKRFRSLRYGWMWLTAEWTSSEPASAYEHWWTWMHDFSNRQFTYSKDRLAALAGISQHYADRTGQTLVLGMSLDDLTRDSSYYLETPPGKSTRPVPSTVSLLPSWTWLAWDNCVVAGPFGRLASSTHESHLVVLQLSIEWTGEPYVSALSEAPHIIALAAVSKVTLGRWPEPDEAQNRAEPLSGEGHSRRWLIQGQTPSEYTQCFLDLEVPEDQTHLDVYTLFLGWNRFPLWDEQTQTMYRGFGTFLVAWRQADMMDGVDDVDIYRRIGVGRFAGLAGEGTPLDPLEHRMVMLL